MIYVSPSIVLDPASAASLQYPFILWDNRITAIAADENALYPASNLLNPQTSSYWKSDSTDDQDIIVDLDIDGAIDSFGIEGHNFGSGQIGISVYGITAEPGADWELLAELAPGNDKPIIGIVDAGYFVQLKFSLAPDAIVPQAAVLYVGTGLRLAKGIVPGFVPPADALQTELLSNDADNGAFLGDIIISQRRSTGLTLRPLSRDYYIANLRDFLQARAPFFFHWSPSIAPLEAAYAKFNGDPRAVMNQANLRYDVSWQMTAVAL